MFRFSSLFFTRICPYKIHAILQLCEERSKQLQRRRPDKEIACAAPHIQAFIHQFLKLLQRVALKVMLKSVSANSNFKFGFRLIRRLIALFLANKQHTFILKRNREWHFVLLKSVYATSNLYFAPS